MITKKTLFLFLSLPSLLLSNQLDTQALSELQNNPTEDFLTSAVTRGHENKTFNNVHVYHTLQTHNVYAENNLVVGGNLKINGDTIGGIGTLNGPSSSTTNAAARFANTAGKTLANSPVIVDDTGNITGVNALTATTITAPTLNGTATNVLFVGGESAAHVAAATTLLNSATHDNNYNTLVKRDTTGSFVTTMITLTGSVTNETDATTKAYVDALSTSDFLAKEPAQAASTTNIISLSGPQTIDGVSLIATNRVLLVGQTDPVKNGLWVVQAGAWTRPLDFISPPEVGRAYVLVFDGNTLGGTSWLCVSPDAAIDADPLSFIEYTLSGETTGNNVGNGTGTLFKDATGNYIHFKSLVAGDHMTITNNVLPDNSDITITVTGYSNTLPTTLVLRDNFNNFSAATITALLTGTASENVLRSGDTMTGKLTLPAGTTAAPSLRFAGSTQTGLSAPTPNTLSFSTNGAQRMNINTTGTVTINQFTSAGVVHNDSFGALASSLAVDADIDAATTIQDTKLATISSPDKILDFATSATSLPINDTIVRRDGNGDFQANIITANRISGGLAGYVLRSGDSMTGTFTVVAGSTAQPSLAFAGSSHTGLSAQTPNTLAMSTNGVERMSINETGTVTIPGTLVLASGTIAQPSLQFSNGTSTGISSPTPDRISFDVNGIERLSIDANGVHALTTAFVINNVISLISTQSLTITDFGTYPITINNDTSLLIVTYVVGVPITVDITFPSNPYEGQLLTIKAILIPTPPVYSNNLNLSYNYTFNPATEEVALLNPTLALNTEFSVPNRGTGGAAVTYIYHTAATGFPQDGWYRYGRG